jgi:hypothetical protein
MEIELMLHSNFYADDKVSDSEHNEVKEEDRKENG